MRRSIALVTIPLAVAATFGVTGLSGIAAADDHIATTVLTGEREIPGPGDADGIGRAIVRVDLATSAVCIGIRFRNIDAPTMAHIHEGAPDVAGPVVVDFTPFIGTGQVKGCTVVDPALAQDILENEQDYYVNVHNAAFPSGAIRGQLGGQ